MSYLYGKLIVVEGLEGAGKSTAVEFIVNFLSSCNIKTITTREPGGTDIGEKLRTIIKDPRYNEILDPKAELLLLYAARIQLIKEVIKPALHKGYWIISDRFELSTLAYQGGGYGFDAAILQELSNFCLNEFKPDATLYLDIEPKIGMQRVKSRGLMDRIEQQSLDFFYRVHHAYLQYVKADPQIFLIDANNSLGLVEKDIKDTLEFILTSK